MINMPVSRTHPSLLVEMTRRHPSSSYVVCGDQRRTYGEFLAEATRIAAGLYYLGVRRGDKVAILMGNQLEWLQAHAAIAMIGGVMVGLNTWWKSRELQHGLSISDSTVLVMADGYLKNDYCAALSEIEFSVHLPKLSHIVCLGEKMPPGAIPFGRLIELGSAITDAHIHTQIESVQPDDLACILFSSGSTSRAKAVGLTHRGLVQNSYGIGRRLHLDQRDRLLMVTSLFYSFSCANGLFAILTHGGSIVLLHHYDTAEVLRLVDEEKCTVVYGPSNIALDAPSHPDLTRRDLSTWRTGITTGAFLPAFDKLGVPEMITAYGLTECYGNSTTSDAKWPAARRQAGEGAPLPGVEVTIVDPQTRAVLPQGAEGEIRLRGNVTPGYYNDPQLTARVIDAEGWFYTGDFGSFDDAGDLHFRGRLGETIKTNGINVSPLEVEEVLQEHLAVKVAIVAGLADVRRDEIVGAMVVLNSDAATTTSELVEHCRRSMAGFKVPRYIEIVTASSLPLTATGKINKRLVKEQLSERYRSTQSD